MLDDILKVLRGQYQPTLVMVPAIKHIRANDAHTAEDVVSESATDGEGTCWEFPHCVRKNGGAGRIVGATVLAETTNIGGWFSLLLHTKTPTAELDDAVTNTAPIAADRDFYAGRIDFAACTDLGGGFQDQEASPSTVGRLPKYFTCAPNDTSLYGITVIRNAVDLADYTWLKFILAIEQY